MSFSKSLSIAFIYTLLTFCTVSCNSKEDSVQPSNQETTEPENEIKVPEVSFSVEPPKESEPIIVLDEPEVYHSVESPSNASPATDRKDFKVVLSVDSLMYLGQSGMMQVWIGGEDVDVALSKGMAKDEKTMSSSVGKFAKITPFAPDFEVIAHSTNLCYKIDPSGSEVRFTLKPKDEGTYRVSADIELFETEDCTGISVPKTAKALSVSVGVDMKKEISKKVHEMESVAWDKFKIFWIALMTLIFGAAIFVVRRFIKNKTGYEEGPPTS